LKLENKLKLLNKFLTDNDIFIYDLEWKRPILNKEENFKGKEGVDK